MKKNMKYILIWSLIALAVYGAIYAAYVLGAVNLYLENTLITIGMNIILALGLNLIIGFSGQFSLGHAGFMAIGAYATAIMSVKNPTLAGFFTGLLLGILLSGIVAVVVGIPTLRLKGDYLAIATLGVSEIIRIVIINMRDITNGPAGIFGIPPFVNWSMVFGFVVVTILIVVNYIHSGSGRATMAIREDEIAAESMGVNTTKYKVIAFVVGAMTASVAGGIYASYIQTIAPKDFGFMKSIDILIIVVFGGIGSVTGTVIAAIALGVMNMYLQNFGELRMIIYALALIIIMIFKPGGLLGTWEFSVKRLFNKKGDDSNASIGS
ncbi:branched-chain amino acid ABC transporter permease [Enterococcus sp. BWB1-3]|uniref:branched-chain amino acid ABC transporter permease n=1 Tax=unclassified Enterococcus TaxID=2608891 RepID=UPI001920BA6F|nr:MULTISPECIES: branched-chain amino acid ABC transporter permease [unclassified Enterococcus]MBL1229246.1 branched-chain amino acid ABC transporter permease [Enterococcus sp. BWB1-3]MCB5951736.1 branched-chain amino acid ABC transporter permease [Enterococcus sp. BWT-B8]MCB5955781.1 branched-chain amino acid ABC transporter permease [Enterococcus sp. CWB-B31]